MVNINNKIQAASHSGAFLEVLKITDEFIVRKVIRDSIPRNKLAANSIKVALKTYLLSAVPGARTEVQKVSKNVIL